MASGPALGLCQAQTGREPALKLPAGGVATACALTAGVLFFGTLFGSAASWVRDLEIHNADPVLVEADVAREDGESRGEAQ